MGRGWGVGAAASARPGAKLAIARGGRGGAAAARMQHGAPCVGTYGQPT